MKQYLSHIEIGILLYIILFNPDWARFWALLTVLAIEGIKYVKGVDCHIRRNLTGKVAVITGGNTGIGKETALELAKQGCEVVIGARDIQKSASTVN